jgi:putative transcriptional regulator
LHKQLFKRLVESIGQMDEIARGMRAPSRELYVEAAKVEADLERNTVTVTCGVGM